MIDHCISAYNLYTEEKLYKIYVTDCLKALVGGTTRYCNIVEGLYKHDEEAESGEEIIKRLSKKLDALGGGENDADIIRGDD